MLPRPLSTHDIELLSAYLDNQIRPSDRLRLERRLRQEPDLQQELDALRRTRRMLRSLPRRQAPRNFTLIPQMVGIRPPLSFARRPVFGMVSALAFVLLIFLLIGDAVVVPEYIGMFPIGGSRAAQEAASAPFEAPAEGAPLDTAPQDTAPLDTAPALALEKEEALIFPTEQPTPTPTETPAPVTMMEQPAAEIAPEPTPEAAIMADAMPSSTEPSLESARGSAGEAPSAAAEEAFGAGLAEPTFTPTPAATETLVVQMAPVEPAEAPAELKQAPPPLAVTAPPDRRSVLWAQVVFWMAELFVVFIASGAGLVALYMWVRRQVWTRRM